MANENTTVTLCCLREAFSDIPTLTPKIVMDILRNNCYTVLDAIPFPNEELKKTELNRRKEQFLLWFQKNASYYRDTVCQNGKNGASSGYCSRSTEKIYAMYTALWILLLLMIICTNILIIVSILKVSHLRQNVSNLFILSLSFSDLFVGISVIPIKIGFYITNMNFCYGINICRLYIMLDSAFFIVSILNLVMIAMDRHLALSYPYKYPTLVTSRRAKIAIILVWLYGICYSALMNLNFDNVSKVAIVIEHGSCQTNHNIYLVFLTYTLHFVFPVICMGVIYFRILRITKDHARSISESVIFDNKNVYIKDDNNNNNDTSPNTNVSCHSRSNSQTCQYITDSKDAEKNTETFKKSLRSIRRPSSKSLDEYRRIVKKATQTVAVVYGTFVVCWLPVVLFAYTYVACEDCIKHINLTLYIIFIQFFPLINSMLNAFLYAIMNKQYRKGFKQVLSRRR